MSIRQPTMSLYFMLLCISMTLGIFASCIITPMAEASPSSIETSVVELEGRMLDPWPSVQQPGGWFPDYAEQYARGASSRYPESMLGWQLMRVGLETGDARVTDAGIAAVDYAVSRSDLQVRYPSVFEGWAVASAYRLAETRLTGDPRFEARRSAWADWLRHVMPTRIGVLDGYSNKWLVEAVGWMEMEATGLRSTVSGSVLEHPERIRPTVRRLVVRLARDSRHRRAARSGAPATDVLSDPDTDPLAYHALSSALYARLLEQLGSEAPAAGWRRLRRLVDASWTLASPRGDVAYAGRSQLQGWTLSMTAAAATRSAAHDLAVGDRQAADRAGRLARVVLDRLSTYPIGPYGMAMTPGIGLSFSGGRPEPAALLGADQYAGAGSYAGLTLVGLEWVEPAVSDGRPLGRTAAVVDRSWGTTAVIRDGQTWLAVRPMRSRASDPRYGTGVLSAQRQVGGGWQDLVSTPPIESALIGGFSRGSAEARGTATRIVKGAVVVVGGWRRPDGRTTGRAVWHYLPNRCGYEARIYQPRPKPYRYVVWLPVGVATVGPTGLHVGGRLVSVDAPASYRIKPALATGSHASTVAAIVDVRPTRKSSRVSVCWK